MKKSFGYALNGLIHAFEREHNLQIFLPVYIAVLMLGMGLRLLAWEWIALLLSGFGFVTIELLNTALERLTDVLDDQKKIVGRNHYHSMLKAAKDVGAAASLTSLIALILVTLIVFCPYAKLYLF